MNEAKIKETAKITQNIVPATLNNADIPGPAEIQLKKKESTASSANISGTQATGLIGSAIGAAVNLAGIIKDGVVENTKAQTGYYEPVPQEDHTTRWLAIGGVTAVVVIVILIIVLKK